MRKVKESVLVGLCRICGTRSRRVVLQHYFGPRLFVCVCDILESNPAVQTGPTGLRQTRARRGEQNCRRQGRIEHDRFDVSIYHCRLQNIGKSATAAPRPVTAVAGRGSSSAALRIAGRNDAGGFHHQNDCSIRGAGAMPDALGNDKSLLWLQVDRAIFEIDDEVPFQDKEELIVVLMFVPVVLALHDPEANNGVVHLAKRLVIPLIGAGFHQGPDVHQVKGRKLDIEVSGVRIILLFAHGLENDSIKVQEV
jgi:hypothetical protein